MKNKTAGEKVGRWAGREAGHPTFPLSHFLTFLLAALLLALCNNAAAQTQTPIYNLATTNSLQTSNWIAIVTHPNQTNGTRKAQIATLINMISVALTNQTATNLSTTNFTTRFGIFNQISAGVFQFWGLEQGTNAVLYFNGSNVVVNGQPGGGSGSVETQWFPDLTQFYTNSVGGFGIKGGASVSNLDVWGGAEFFTGGILVGGNSWFTNGLTVSGLTSLGSVVATSIIVPDLTVTSNAIVSGTNLANWLKLTGGQAGQGVFAIFDNNTNLVGWLGTNSFPTHAVLVTASNAVHTLLVSASNTVAALAIANDTTTSNALRTLLIANDTTTSNGVVTLLVANDTTTSNGLHAITLSSSNSLATLFIANDTFTSNALRTLLIANDTTTSNGAVAFSMTESNTLDTKIENTLTNYFGFGYSVGAGFSNATSKPLITAKTSRMIEVVNAIAGTGIGITPTATGMVWTSTGSTLPDADYGDITASAGGAVLTIDNDVVTDAKLRESAGFSVIGKTDTGTGNPADIIAAADGVLRRSGSGNLIFGSLVTANYGDDSITFSKFQNIAEDRLLGRDSAGSGNAEEITLFTGLSLTGGALKLDIDQRFSTLYASNSVTTSNLFTRTIVNTNTIEQGITNIATTTNIVVDWKGPQIVTTYPTGAIFMVSFVNTPAASNGLYKIIKHRIIITNAPTMVAPSGLGWANPPVLLAGSVASPSTNTFYYEFDGNTNLVGTSAQEDTTGSGATTVLSNAPSLFAPKIVNATISRLAAIGPDGRLTNSVYSETDIANLQGGTNGLNTRMANAEGATNGLTTRIANLESRALTNLYSRSLSNATMVPVVFGGASGTSIQPTNATGALYGLEQGNNISITPNGSNHVIAATGLMNGATNANQFGASTTLTLKDGVSLTNQVNIGTNNVESITNLSSATWRLFTQNIFTNNSGSNIVVNFALTNQVEIWFTNNLTFTNWSGAVDGGASTWTAILRPQLINRGVNWGNLGLSNPGYSVAIATNANNLLWTTLTNGKVYALSIARVRTNLFPTLTLWE